MDFDPPGRLLDSMLGFFSIEIAFIITFTLLILSIPSQGVGKRGAGVFVLAAATYMMESLTVPLCLEHGRPHWAAVLVSILWVQLLNASDLLLVLRIDAVQIRRTFKPGPGTIKAVGPAMGLFNSRRIGTPWQVNNVPSATGLGTQSRTSFVFRRLAVTLLATCLSSL